MINKLRQDKKAVKPLNVQESVSADSEAPDIMCIFSMVDYGIHTHTEAVRYIFISEILFCVLMVQGADLCCEVKINNDMFSQNLFTGHLGFLGLFPVILPSSFKLFVSLAPS